MDQITRASNEQHDEHVLTYRIYQTIGAYTQLRATLSVRVLMQWWMEHHKR